MTLKKCNVYKCDQPVEYEGATMCELHAKVSNQLAIRESDGGNVMGKITLWAGIFAIVIGFFIAISYDTQQPQPFAAFFYIFFSAILTGIIFFALSEIIRLLHEINQKK